MNKLCDFFGHKYHPRYSEQVPAGFEKLGTFYPPALEAFKTKTYHFDICVRCGDKVVPAIKLGGCANGGNWGGGI